jgi:hypothetical protein
MFLLLLQVNLLPAEVAVEGAYKRTVAQMEISAQVIMMVGVKISPFLKGKAPNERGIFHEQLSIE